MDEDERLSMIGEMTYQYWRHRISGATFAVRVENGEVTGFCGPVVADDPHADDLPLYAYDSPPETLDWVWEHAGEFVYVG